MTQLILSYLQEFGTDEVGIACPGIPTKRGEIIAYNISFSPLTFIRQLEDQGVVVTVKPDIEAIAEAVRKRGYVKNYQKTAVATFSTGFSYVDIEDGIVKPSREAGHQLYNPDSSFVCNCGQRGHWETYLSSSGAGIMARALNGMNLQHPIVQLSLKDLMARGIDLSRLSPSAVYALAFDNVAGAQVYRAFAINPNQEPQQTVIGLQMQAIADFFTHLTKDQYGLEAIICTGGMTKSQRVLFEPATEMFNEMVTNTSKPKIIINQYPYFGVLGAALIHYMRAHNT